MRSSSRLSSGSRFTVALLAGGRWLYATMGGSGASLDAAMIYSSVVFAGAILVWLFNSLANVIRGTGNMAFPALVTCIGVVVLIPLSPCLIFGLGPFPRLGVAGGAVAVCSIMRSAAAVLAAYLRSGRSVVRLAFRGIRFRWSAVRRHSPRRRGRGADHGANQSNHRDCNRPMSAPSARPPLPATAPVRGSNICSFRSSSVSAVRWSPWSAPISAPAAATARSRVAWIGAAIAAAHLRAHRTERRRRAARLAVAVRHRAGDDRRWIALSACGRSGLWPVRSRHGALFRLARRRTVAVAVHSPIWRAC